MDIQYGYDRHIEIFWISFIHVKWYELLRTNSNSQKSQNRKKKKKVLLINSIAIAVVSMVLEWASRWILCFLLFATASYAIETLSEPLLAMTMMMRDEVKLLLASFYELSLSLTLYASHAFTSLSGCQHQSKSPSMGWYRRLLCLPYRQEDHRLLQGRYSAHSGPSRCERVQDSGLWLSRTELSQESQWIWRR